MIQKPVPGGGDHRVLGASITAEGVNFAVYSETASALWVCLFDEQDREIGRYPLDGHEGNVHCGLIAGIGAGARYGLRADGAYDPARALYFDPQRLLVDPYARRLDRPFVRDEALLRPREAGFDTAMLMPKAMVSGESGRPAAPRRKGANLIYELNVRGYTLLHPHVPLALRGTLAGLASEQVVEHLLTIGVDTVELMPISAFIDDAHLPRLGLTNAWGYNPVALFAPDPRLAPRGTGDVRALADLLRKSGISLVLDVVLNHTGEGDAFGPVLSMKGLDARTYYRYVDVDGQAVLVNDTGTGNTLRCDHPVVQQLVLDNLRYWVTEGGVSGFRFDLAPVLGRDPGFNANAELLERIKSDPLLSRCLLIAEPWDCGPSGYQLGQFGKEFREWNDTYRDQVRSFWRGDDGKIGALASKVAGSSEIFDQHGRRPSHGVNFLAAHDGFTLRDLVSYGDKHNEANGENNADGHNHNLSWNSGVEGATTDSQIEAARRRDVRALLTTLFMSRGTPMIQQGDEMWRTQHGNNNAYAQHNALTWVDWPSADASMIALVSALSRFRLAHPALTNDHFLSGVERGGRSEVVWLHPEGRKMNEGDWNASGSSILGMHLRVAGDEVLVWFNRRIEPVVARLPDDGWMIGFTSDEGGGGDIGDAHVTLPPRSVVALVRRESASSEDGEGTADTPERAS